MLLQYKELAINLDTFYILFLDVYYYQEIIIKCALHIYAKYSSSIKKNIHIYYLTWSFKNFEFA